jgi:hypothetical protein
VDPAFAGLLMISTGFRNYLQTVKSVTTSVCAIYQRSLMAAPFAFPSLDEQRSIAHRVHAALNRIDRLASETFSARNLIDQLDQVILVNAFQGRRSVQGAVLPMMLCYLTPIYFVPYARSPASPRPGTMNARSSRDSSIAAVQIGTSGWAPRIRSMP